MKVLDCVLIQLAGVVVFCWLCDAAAGRQGSLQTRNSRGGCSRYGHACWGGHGKRSSRPVKPAGQLALPLGLRPSRSGGGQSGGPLPEGMVRPGLAGPRPGLPSLELERDASETLEVVDPQDTSDTADLAPEVDDTLPSETGDAGGQRSFQADSRYRLNGVADFVPLASDQSIQSPEAVEENDGVFQGLRSQNHRRFRNKEKDVQVLIIPEDESQTSDLLHIYQILGRNPRKQA